MTITNAMVLLAAGLGTRMRPITYTTPKPLVRIAGTPMIDYAFDMLADAGVRRAIVNIHHFAEQIAAHLAAYECMDIVLSDERDRLMNSGDGLAKGLKLLDRSPVFVMNADLFWIGETPGAATNLQRLATFFDPAVMAMALLCVALENTTGHNGKQDFDLAADSRLTRYRDGDQSPVVYAGAIAMSPALMDDAPRDPFNLNIYFDRAIASGRLFGLMLQGHWLTVGTPDAIGAVEAAIRHHGEQHATKESV